MDPQLIVLAFVFALALLLMQRRKTAESYRRESDNRKLARHLAANEVASGSSVCLLQDWWGDDEHKRDVLDQYYCHTRRKYSKKRQQWVCPAGYADVGCDWDDGDVWGNRQCLRGKEFGPCPRSED